MSATPQPSPDAGPGNLDSSQVSRLLQLGLSGPHRPVDDLIDRIGEPGGREWFLQALEDGPAAASGSPREMLIEGKATVDGLLVMKEQGKALFGNEASGSDSRLSGMIAYFLAVAAALVHYGVRISGRAKEDLEPIFLDLASAAPGPWGEFLSKAALISRSK